MTEGTLAMRWRWFTLALLSVFMLAFGARTAHTGDQSAPDLDEILAALRPLVGHPAWAVMHTDSQDLGAGRDAGIEDARFFLATQDGFESTVMAGVFRFSDSRQARQYLERERAKASRQAEELAKLGLPDDLITVGDGAGGENALSGLHVSMRMADLQHLDMQVFQHGPVVVLLYVNSAPRLDRSAQDGVLDHAAAYLRDAESARKLPPPTPVEFEGQAELIGVRVEAPDGSPVSSARFVVRLDRGSGSSTSLQFSLPKGAGQVPVSRRLPTKVFVFDARGPDGEGMAVRPAGPFPIGPEQAELVIRLQPSRTISGRVLSAAGEAVEGIRVEATLVRPDRSHNQAEAPSAPDPMRVWSDVLPESYAQATVLPDGSFKLVGLVEGPHRLRILRGEELASPELLEVEAGSADVVLRVRATPDFRLKITDPHGAPVAMASVNVSTEGFRAHVLSDEAGVATLKGLDPSRKYWLSVSGPQSEETPLLSTHRDDWKPKDMTVRLRAAWLLRGVVQDEHGQPVKAWIHQRENGGQTTAADGSFELELPRHPVELAASPLGADRISDDLTWSTIQPTPDRVVLTVRGALLAVRVQDANGMPVPRAHLRLSLLDASNRVVSTRIEDVEDGVWRGAHPKQRFSVQVFQAQTRRLEPLNLAPAQLEALGPTEDELTVRLVEGGTVTGRILSASGTPLADVEVGALPSGAPPIPPRHSLSMRAHAWTSTEADGTFTLKGLGAGSYDLRVDVPDAMLPATPISVMAGNKD
ncbi:MAG: carboxypeptidase regulatory-like domain-containing protein, partial [Planctomycetes bacterium]|nr:carboxypeptidase regulatory-like domain-containing protein [Planctomycetota bacterium]